MNDDWFDKEHERRRKFFASLGFAEVKENSYELRQEYAYPECLATTVVAEYGIADGDIHGGHIFVDVWLRSLATPENVKVREHDFYIVLRSDELHTFSRTEMRKYIKELMRSTEAKLKNVFDLERIS